MSNSSSSESEDEEKAKLIQALDPDIFKVINHSGSGTKKSASFNGTGGQDHPHNVSKRPKLAEDEDFVSPKPFYLDITPACQKFIAKQLTKTLDKTLKAKSPPPAIPYLVPADSHLGIRLFSTSTTILTENDLLNEYEPAKPSKHKKKRKRRKKSSAASSESSSDTDVEKLRAVAVTADWVLKNA